jgi:hypothetical protein
MAALLSAACSNKESGRTLPPDKPPEVASVLGASWGSGPDQLGMAQPEEGSPEAPKSFVVDASGRIHVLDQVNRRVQSFDAGKPAGSIALPDRPFEDIELDTSGYLVLDLFRTPAVVAIGQDGAVGSELPLPAEEVPEPGLVTALVKSSDGVWVEVETEFLVQVSDANGAVAEPRVIPGQLFDGGQVFRAVVEQPTTLTLYHQENIDAAPTELSMLQFPHAVRQVVLARGSGSGLWVVVLLEHAQTDPTAPTTQEHVLVELTADGQELARTTLPAGNSPFESFRDVRAGADGKIYVMKTTDVGLEILKVTP